MNALCLCTNLWNRLVISLYKTYEWHQTKNAYIIFGTYTCKGLSKCFNWGKFNVFKGYSFYRFNGIIYLLHFEGSTLLFMLPIDSKDKIQSIKDILNVLVPTWHLKLTSRTVYWIVRMLYYWPRTTSGMPLFILVCTCDQTHLFDPCKISHRCRFMHTGEFFLSSLFQIISIYVWQLKQIHHDCFSKMYTNFLFYIK